ncbi:MAG: DUF4260 domain-containing protein [Cyclobacteriaceae bacterium]|nr:DUF4260 domain-containing protein [Cyclobacteriaceae bacterium]
MKNLLKLEEVLMFGLAIYLNSLLPFAGWVFWALFLLPDIGMLGYLVNARVGAITYNIFHHKGIAIAFYFLGVFLAIPELTLAGVVLFGHSSFDRILGYGLKHFDNFKNTHLGWIGK